MTRATFPRAGTRPNTTVRDSRRRLTGDSAVSPRSNPATWRVAGAATARVVAAAVFQLTRRAAAAVGGSLNLLAEYVNLPDDGLAK